MQSGQSLGKSYWMCAGFTLLSALVSAGFSLYALRITGGETYALYAAARSVALPFAVIYATLIRSRGAVAVMALAMTVVQVLDGIIGFRLHDPSRAFGPVFFAAMNCALLTWMSRVQVTQKTWNDGALRDR